MDCDPRIGTFNVDTWQARPADTNPTGSRTGGWVVCAGEYEDADVWMQVIAEYPKDVAEFIVQAVRNEHARQPARTSPTT